ncbi:histidine phosphatase family protein [Sneathiella chinensis]|uniref:Histidine phosphatase family protein n=1 Tax=Sneathiella chinensis TaxID=349750 RepID=A0ABQ5U471_9PROT|nr:histidine phosphatase family protein [Sneathiella chinensis]GLQ06033.1 hypothetical protein GCM10007924_12540 [Sneathiella chinensis]
MPRIFLVRHGEASGSWDKATDPGLSPLGQQQARQASERLQGMTHPVAILSSPLLRAQETAHPLEQDWGRQRSIHPEVSEIPSHGVPFDQRRSWLDRIMKQGWTGQEDALVRWRDGILGFLSGLEEDAVVFTHFVVINTVVGAIQQDDRIISFRPDNCSITTILSENGQLKLIEQGGEAITLIG